MARIFDISNSILLSEPCLPNQALLEPSDYQQLATARPGLPLFEIFFTVINGEYKQQAVYLKQNGDYSGGLHKCEIKNEISSLNPSDTSAEGQNGIYNEDIESLEQRDDDSDVTDELTSIQNILRDIIPGVKVKVFKVVAPGRVDRDLIAKVIEEIIEEEDDENDEELDSLEPEDIKSGSDMEETETNAGDAPNDFSEEKGTMPVKIVIEGLMQNLHADVPPENLVRMPASLEKKNRISFSFVPEHDEREFVTNKKGQASGKKVAPRSSQLSANLVMSDLAKVILSKEKAVYLKQNGDYSGGLHKCEIKNEISSLNPSDTSAEGQNGIYNEDIESLEQRDDDSDVTDELTSIQNILRDIIPGVKVKVLKVVAPGRVDRDLIAKVIEEIIEEEDDENDEELDSLEPEDIKSGSDMEETETNAGDAPNDFSEEKGTMPVKIVIEGLMQNLHADVPPENLVRMPASLEKKNRISFSFVPEHDEREFVTNKKGQASGKKVAPRSSQLSANLVMSDLAKVILSKEKVLRDIGELISFAANRAQNHQPLLGPTLFNRIEIPATSDPLAGLYVGAHGMYTSEILYLKRKFGQWQEDPGTQKQGNLEFYEYVEAIKLTGDLSIPAGQVAFRAKIGKRYQLPHKGIIPEELGVVARYKGQGRLADPGFRNPQWVDGELVILDGKYIRGGPVIGFVYWTSGYNILLFFNRLKLPD
ncbi:hypothetical protein COCNU_07G013390 [Cocos nucifera]|uniref:Protein EXECUTER 1, chloroplastic n=1 Tax=Cocos nucifera TaxID=13894 RepID=A0A8K0IGJ3_COCNU|nr:hypothetical protein COCNU_07G013390 [Cocos nucifera]